MTEEHLTQTSGHFDLCRVKIQFIDSIFLTFLVLAF